MSDIKPGIIAYLKVTEEPMFVLAIQQIPPVHVHSGVLSGVQALVRRPNVADKGNIVHVEEKFFVEELETKEAQAIRKLAELEALRAQFPRQERTSSPGQLGSSN